MSNTQMKCSIQVIYNQTNKKKLSLLLQKLLKTNNKKNFTLMTSPIQTLAFREYKGFLETIHIH